MRTRILTTLVLALFLCASCSKDDKVNPDKIIGEWYWDTSYPHLIMDVGASYIFNDDGTFIKRVSGMEPPSVSTIEGTYQISIAGNPRVLTLSADELGEQYYILKLSSGVMMLEHTDKTISDKKLRFLRTK